MDFQEVKDIGRWNALVSAHAPRSGAFLQTGEWGVFQASRGRSVKRIAALGDTMFAQLVETPLALGQHYLYCPRGPVFAQPHPDTHAAVELLRTLGEQNGAMFCRFDPPVESARPVHWSGVHHTIEIQPADTLILDLTQSKDQLFAHMHTKTRYNIRVAQRKDVQIELDGTTPFDQVWKLFEATAFRGAFNLHSKRYYHDLLRHVNSKDCRSFLAVARYKGEVVAANLMIDCGKTRTYLHGASSDEYRNVMAPFLLHWALIEDAQEKGMTAYDWWGIAPAGAGEGHPWAGITRFKLGFGGEHVSYPGTFDLLLKPASYRLYMAARKVVRRIR